MRVIQNANRLWFAALLTVGVLVAVGSAGAEQTPRQGGTLVVSVTRQPTNLNPLRAVNASEYMLNGMMYSGLTRLAPDMQPVPDLAVKWTHNTDLTQWTFDLRHGVMFRTGEEVTSADVVATFQAILNPKSGSPARSALGPVSIVEALGKYQVRFTTSAPFANMPVALANMDAKVVPQAIATGDLSKLNAADYGSGPFILKSFTPGESAVLVRNPHYFVDGEPYLDEVKQVVYPDATAEVTAFLDGQVDLMAGLPIPDVKKVSGSSGVKVLESKSGEYVDVVMRDSVKPFSDIRVRRALQLAIDRKALVSILLDGYGQAAYDTPISPAYRYYDKSLPLITQNILEARRLLNEAGYPNGLNLTLYAANSPEIRTQLGVAIQAMARPAGFNISVKTIPYSTYLSQVWKKAPFYVGFYGMRPTENGIFQLTFTSSSAWNESQWDNKQFDSLVQQAMETADPSKRAQLYGQAQVLMQKQVPVLIPIFLDILQAEHDYVHNYRLNPTGNVYNFTSVWVGANAPAH